MRTWLYKGDPMLWWFAIWVADLGEGRYVKCQANGEAIVFDYVGDIQDVFDPSMWEVLT